MEFKKKFNKKKLQDKFKNFDYKKEWAKTQKEAPKIAGAIKLIFFAILGAIALRACNSCTGSPKQDSPKVENSIVSSDTSQANETKEYVEPTEQKKAAQIESTERDYQFSFTQDSRVTKEQLDYLMSQDVLRKYSSDEIRMAYFEAQDKWFQDYLLKTKDGELVNFKKYLGDE